MDDSAENKKLLKLRELLLNPKVWKKLFLSCSILILSILAAFAVRYLSNQVVPHDSDNLVLALRGMLEFGMISGFIFGVMLFIKSYQLNSGNEYFLNTPSRTIFNLFYIPFSLAALFLLPALVLFGFVFAFLDVFIFDLVYGFRSWEYPTRHEFYLYGAAITACLPLYVILAGVWSED